MPETRKAYTRTAGRNEYVEPWREHRRNPKGTEEPEHVVHDVVEVPGVEAKLDEDGEVVGHVKVTRRVREDQAEEYARVYEEHVEQHGEPEDSQ